MNARNTLLAVDGNSLLHRSYHALQSSDLRAPDGTPMWAIHGMWRQMCQIVDRVGATTIIIGFDGHPSVDDPFGDGHDTAGTPLPVDRRTVFSGYKEGRATKHDDLRTQLALAPQHYQRAGLHVIQQDGLEADDVIASAAHTATTQWGFDTVIATSDRDAFSLIRDATPDRDTSVRVLRVVNGGIDASPLLDGARLETLCGVYPNEYLVYAALRGDKSDNLPGVLGIGEKTAVALLAALRGMPGETLDTLLADHDAGGTKLTTIIGRGAANKFNNAESRENLQRNLIMMSQYVSVDIGNPNLLPLDPEPLTIELNHWALRGALTTALKTLSQPHARITTSSPTPPEPNTDTLF